VPILLASIGAMRRGEIVAATLDDIKDGYIHIHRAAALNEHQEQVIKEYPKTE
jgi:integrase